MIATDLWQVGLGRDWECEGSEKPDPTRICSLIGHLSKVHKAMFHLTPLSIAYVPLWLKQRPVRSASNTLRKVETE